MVNPNATYNTQKCTSTKCQKYILHQRQSQNNSHCSSWHLHHLRDQSGYFPINDVSDCDTIGDGDTFDADTAVEVVLINVTTLQPSTPGGMEAVGNNFTDTATGPPAVPSACSARRRTTWITLWILLSPPSCVSHVICFPTRQSPVNRN